MCFINYTDMFFELEYAITNKITEFLICCLQVTSTIYSPDHS